MSESNTNTHTYMMIGERLCLDFANTVSWHDSDERAREWFTSYEKLVDWSHHAKILTEEQVEVLLKEAEHHPLEADQVLERTIELREAIFRLFRSIAKDESPQTEDLSILNQAVGHFYQSIRLAYEEGHYTLQVQNQEGDLDSMLAPIIQSAIDILTSEKELKRVKLCEGCQCGWLFLDTSRNRSRRWCSMADCGNRAKARRFYQNKK